MLIHASCVAVDGRGVLLCGPSGSGKSDLALRLIDGGARLVADDQVMLQAADGALIARPPPVLAGRIELRGVGIVAIDHVADTRVALVCDLVSPDRVARLPEPARRTFLGIAIPVLALSPFEASAAAKIRLALSGPFSDLAV